MSRIIVKTEDWGIFTLEFWRYEVRQTLRPLPIIQFNEITLPDITRRSIFLLSDQVCSWMNGLEKFTLIKTDSIPIYESGIHPPHWTYTCIFGVDSNHWEAIMCRFAFHQLHMQIWTPCAPAGAKNIGFVDEILFCRF